VSSGGDAVRLERIFEADIDRVFRAFTDPDELVHWLGTDECADLHGRDRPSRGR
jgi:uncharacterized protein YndB with AHSA1/START domain